MFLAVTRVPAVAANPAPRDSPILARSSSNLSCARVLGLDTSFTVPSVAGPSLERGLAMGIAAKGQFDIRSRRRIDAWSPLALAMQGRVRPALFPFHPPHRSSLFATHK
jgi:hypothetical protein